MDWLFSILLLAGGAITGSLVNWCIYNLGWFGRRPISPWGLADPSAPRRRWWDRIPVVGWMGLRRESVVHGRGFWVRPLLIELVFAAAAVWFWHWQMAGGLVGGRVPVAESDAHVWFAAHGLLIALLVIATFIDFDEQTIPDWITIPGTLTALLFAVVWPGVALPELKGDALTGLSWQPVDYGSPLESGLLAWPWNWRGLLAAQLIIAFWIWGLVPKIITLRWGLWRGLKIALASLFRPRRRTVCPIRVSQRRPYGITWLLLLMGLAVSLLTAVVFSGPAQQWTSLLSAILGLGMGGGIIWLVRIIASQAMGQEAMGFGDVTLMGMIGAFLGWQASLIVFALAPFAGVAVALVQFIVSRNRALAFGPYLALAAIFVILGWSFVWNDWARNNYFQMPGLLLGALAVFLVLMPVLLLLFSKLRGSAESDSMADEAG